MQFFPHTCSCQCHAYTVHAVIGASAVLPTMSLVMECYVLFSLVQDGIWGLGKAQMCSTHLSEVSQHCLWNGSDAIWGISIDVSSLVQDPHCADEILCFCLCSFVMWRRLLWLRVILVWSATSVFWFGPSGLASHSVMPVMTLTLASDQGQYVGYLSDRFTDVLQPFFFFFFLPPDFSRALFGVA